MKYDPSRCVIIVDFTKFTIIDDGSIQCFVVSVLSQGTVNDDEWKPHILYYDFLAQNEKKERKFRQNKLFLMLRYIYL